MNPTVLPSDEASPLFTLGQNTFHQIKEIMSQFWLTPHEMKTRLETLIDENKERTIIVTGETNNIVLYVIDETGVLTFTPFSDLGSNVLLRELYDEASLPRNINWHVFPKSLSLLQRLSLPRVLLINPCVREHFPVPRLCLSIGLLASYLRKYQKAEVFLIDMQVGSTIDEILQAAVQLQPALIGLSISYGQKSLAFSILNDIYRAKQAEMIKCQVIVGNIIPASFPEEFLAMYPDILIAHGEGEITILKLVDSLVGRGELAGVPGIFYLDETGKMCSTPSLSVPVETIPLPALDTINDLVRCRGALTLELSRGCQWNVCTFCPREHKARHWKTFSSSQVLEQFRNMGKVCEHFGLARHIFLADEEFVGGMNDDMETQRMIEMAHHLIADNLHMSFDAAARVDQVYDPKMQKAWHIQRMKMWHLCHQAGLDRLFLGVESGSNAQLRRYGKGIEAEHSILAIRILSALGIPLRFGFITFDQLMIGFKDLKENVAFLERTDAFMQKVDVTTYGYEKLFDLLVHDTAFVKAHSANKPLYEGVSYLLATMEVLINSRYKIMLQNAERRYKKILLLDREQPDSNMGRYRVTFVDDLVKDISISCQKWIDRHFGLAYSVKSLYKVAPLDEKRHLMHWMVAYRQMSFFLLKCLVLIFSDEANEINSNSTPFCQYVDFHELREKFAHDPRKHDVLERVVLMEEIMNFFDAFVADENTALETLFTLGSITDTVERQLSQALSLWKTHKGVWRLING